jgi:Polyketide cyclase / dehydrase and lipid transport
MLEFEDNARSEAPPEEVWKILYDPARFTEWWEGMETTSVGDGEFTLQHVDFPELQIPNRLEVRDAGSAVVISCLLHDFVYNWRLEPLDGGQATQISVHVAIPDEKVEHFEEFQRAMMGASVRRLAEVAARPTRPPRAHNPMLAATACGAASSRRPG